MMNFFYVVSFLKKFRLEYSCFTMLCWFLLHSKLNQLYIYIYVLFFRFPSHLGHHRALSGVPCANSRFSLVIYVIHSIDTVYINPNLPIHPTPPSQLGNHKFVLYICVSISALQIRSSVPFLHV